MGLLEWWSIPRKAWIIILTELCVIVGLSGSVASVYLNDIYFQAYINSLAPILVPVVSVGFGIASASTATILYFRMKNLTRAETTVEGDAKPRGQRHAARRIASTDTGTGKNIMGSTAQGSRLRPLMPTGTGPGRGSASSSAEKKEPSIPQ